MERLDRQEDPLTNAQFRRLTFMGGGCDAGRGLIGVCLAVALTGCMGRPPDPVPVVQPQDRYMNCTAIYAEVRENNRRVRELGREQGWKVVQNVAAGVGGLFIPILWFGMDWQGTAHKEAAALQARQEYLGALAIQKRCGRPV